MSKFIHPATKESALEVAKNLRPDDYREIVEGYGLLPTIHLPLFVQSGENIVFTVPNGKTAGMAGVESDGRIWMLCTPEIHKYPLTFAREYKRWVDQRT